MDKKPSFLFSIQVKIMEATSHGVSIHSLHITDIPQLWKTAIHLVRSYLDSNNYPISEFYIRILVFALRPNAAKESTSFWVGGVIMMHQHSISTMFQQVLH